MADAAKRHVVPIAELRVNSRSEILPTYRVGAPVVCAPSSSMEPTGPEPPDLPLSKQERRCYAPRMLKNATILIIRHGEKPSDGPKLSLAGVERAAAYAPYFESFTTPRGEALTIEHLFAAQSSHESERPVLTVTPLARALKLVIDDSVADGDYKKLADWVLAKDSPSPNPYDGSTLLICWHHEHAIPLAEALGIPKHLTPTFPWPANGAWPEDVFGWVLMIGYDGQGAIDYGRTLCVSTALMYGDYGQLPPGPVH